ncbi:protein of unknown function DUF775 [Trypanosoma melophagium]|uniref:protein of unknown function DUF775 n=1 Tax=Trypanosoma melophagium TaxID=715481 RepID=UPI003519DCD1|nr:protein of unknown function DUF775 [Trypanosoma melophagium]
MPTAPPFAVVLPGRPVMTEFQCLDGVRWVAPLGEAPASIVVFLIFGASPLPPGVALAFYLAREDDGAFVHIGHLSHDRPSAVLPVPSVFLNVDAPVRVVLGVSSERAEDVANIVGEQQEERAATRLAIAERIVEDLYNFVSSYGRVLSADPNDPQSEETIYLPASFVNRWRERVLVRLRKDASFWK